MLTLSASNLSGLLADITFTASVSAGIVSLETSAPGTGLFFYMTCAHDGNTSDWLRAVPSPSSKTVRRAPVTTASSTVANMLNAEIGKYTEGLGFFHINARIFKFRSFSFNGDWTISVSQCGLGNDNIVANRPDGSWRLNLDAARGEFNGADPAAFNLSAGSFNTTFASSRTFLTTATPLTIVLDGTTNTTNSMIFRQHTTATSNVLLGAYASNTDSWGNGTVKVNGGRIWRFDYLARANIQYWLNFTAVS